MPKSTIKDWNRYIKEHKFDKLEDLCVETKCIKQKMRLLNYYVTVKNPRYRDFLNYFTFDEVTDESFIILFLDIKLIDQEYVTYFLFVDQLEQNGKLKPRHFKKFFDYYKYCEEEKLIIIEKYKKYFTEEMVNDIFKKVKNKGKLLEIFDKYFYNVEEKNTKVIDEKCEKCDYKFQLYDFLYEKYMNVYNVNKDIFNVFDYDIVLDGGNILKCVTKGDINQFSINRLTELNNKLKENNYKPLVIISKVNSKKIKDFKKMGFLEGVNFMWVDGKMNDDIYIQVAAWYKQCHFVTNDLFCDMKFMVFDKYNNYLNVENWYNTFHIGYKIFKDRIDYNSIYHFSCHIQNKHSFLSENEKIKIYCGN